MIVFAGGSRLVGGCRCGGWCGTTGDHDAAAGAATNSHLRPAMRPAASRERRGELLDLCLGFIYGGQFGRESIEPRPSVTASMPTVTSRALNWPDSGYSMNDVACVPRPVS